MSITRYQRTAAADVPTPPVGRDAIFVDAADGHTKRKDSAGVVHDIEAMGSGDVAGPASATDNAIARFDGVSGKVIQNSLAIVSDLGSITLPPGQKVSDADLLDGQEGVFYLARGNHTGTQAPATISPQGAGSTLDADLLDGQQGAFYLARGNHTGTQAPATISPQGAASTLDADLLDGQEGVFYLARGNHTGTQAPSTISPQGTGSTLDADLLDGFHATAFAAVLGFGAGSVSATTTDRFLYPGYDSSVAQTTEIFMRAPRAGTLANLQVQMVGAGNGNAIVFTVRVEAANTAITASLASTASQAADNTNTAAVTAGQRISIIVTKAASVGTSPSDIYITLGLRAA